MNFDAIPTDLIISIFSRLPAKSIARFHCVSKLWASILSRQDFTELFLTRSSAQPRLLFAVEENGVWSFFSLPQDQSPYENSPSSSLAFHMKFPPYNMQIYHFMRIYPSSDQRFSCGYASGLIYFSGVLINEVDSGVSVICNPITGRYATLPYLKRYRKSYSFLGFDPIDKQFKVLFIACPDPDCSDDHKILTFSTGEMRWRKIKCPLLTHEPVSEGICINGVLYYVADYQDDDDDDDEWSHCVIVCFDVRSEKFKFIYYPESFCELINYKGKLGVIYYGRFASANELRLWVLEDVEKQEWSKYAYTLRNDKFFSHKMVSVVGMTATGEIVFSSFKQMFYVFYFNPQRNTLQRVEIKGFGANTRSFENRRIYTFVDHVEDLNVNDAKLLHSSIYHLCSIYVTTGGKKNQNKKKKKKKKIHKKKDKNH